MQEKIQALQDDVRGAMTAHREGESADKTMLQRYLVAEKALRLAWYAVGEESDVDDVRDKVQDLESEWARLERLLEKRGRLDDRVIQEVATG
jgi:hypothetical protein